MKYVSDGDPATFTIPTHTGDAVDLDRVKACGCTLRTYVDPDAVPGE